MNRVRIFLTGVGGQGTLTATTLLANTALAQGLAVVSGEIHGMAQRGVFRQDLLFRLNAFVVAVAPLRERREDIPLLVQYFLSHSGFSQRIAKRVSEPALRCLVDYDWPGNVRELRNVVERAIILSGNKLKIDQEHLTLSPAVSRAPPAAGLSNTGVTLTFDHEPTLAEIERRYLELLLARHQGRRGLVARILGIGERTLYRLLADINQIEGQTGRSR